MAEAVPLADQIACVERELRMREKTYPRHVKQNKLTQAAADLELVRMRAVLGTLQGLPAAIVAERDKVLSAALPFLHSSAHVKLCQRVKAMP